MTSCFLRLPLVAILLAAGLYANGQPAPAFHWPGSTPAHANSPFSPAASAPVAASTPIAQATLPAPSPVTRGADYSKAAYLNSLAEAEMKAQKIPGLSMAVVVDSTLVYCAGFGIANSQNKLPVSKDTVFNLASISKTFTAVAALKLAENGRLDINAPVQKYVPTFPQKQWPVTSAMLLGNLAGIRHYKGRESLSTTPYADVITPLEIFQNDPLVHQPGSAYLYSSYGFNLLGAAAQGASGEPFISHMQRHIFAPSGMKDVRVYDGSADPTSQAMGFIKAGDGKTLDAPVFNATNKIPSGGFMTSASDMGNFMVALFNGKLITEPTRKLMWTPQRLTNGRESKYGMGWFISKWRGNLVVLHGGVQPGFSTLVYALPHRGFAIVLLTNLSDAKLNNLAEKIRDTVF